MTHSTPEEKINLIASLALSGALKALNEPTSVVPLVLDGRYCHRWIDVSWVESDGIEAEPVRLAGEALALIMRAEGVTQFMPLMLPGAGVLAVNATCDRAVVRAARVWDPEKGQFQIQIAMAGLKP